MSASKADVSLLATKPTSISVNFSRIATVVARLATESSITAAATTTATGEASHAHTSFNTSIFILVHASFLPLLSDSIHIAKKLDQLVGSVPDIDTLILSVWINVVELAEHP